MLRTASVVLQELQAAHKSIPGSTAVVTSPEVRTFCVAPDGVSSRGCLLQIYREKLRAEVEGRPYTPPPPSSVKPVSRSGSSGSMSRSRSAGRVAAGNDDSWDEWGDGGKARTSHLPQTCS